MTTTKSKLKCPFCGSTRLRPDGWAWPSGIKYRRYLCKNCNRRTTKPRGLKRAAAGGQS